MGVTPGSLGRRYAPFLVVAAVQVLLVAIVPSRDPRTTSGLTAAGATGPSAADRFAAPGESAAGAPDLGSTAAGAPGAAGASGATLTAGPGSGPGDAAGGTAGAASGATTAGTGVASVVDRSRCGPDGREIGPTYYMPLCVPVWHGGDNGGATMTGVSATEIRYTYYEAKSDPQVNAILATQGLAASETDHCAAWAAFDKTVNKRWELYGRRVVPLDGPGAHKGSVQNGCDTHYPHYMGQCSLTPPDPPCERAEAAQIASMNPAYVIAPVADPALFNELAKRHIVVSGGFSATAPGPASYFADAAPYWWEVVDDGTRSMRLLAEYYCKKLIAQPPAFAGPDVRLGATTRKLAIAYPATNGDPTWKLSADLFVQLVSGGMCGSARDGVKAYPYQSDITSAQQQSQSTVVAMKNDHVTTVVCFCDPIAPVFFTAAADQQSWHPEWLLPGTGLLDYDVLGRLYSPTQWAHAFGPSELYEFRSLDQYDSARAWRDAGNSGVPDPTEQVAFSFFTLMGNSFQLAGPDLTPDNIRNGLFRAPARGGWAESNHDPHDPLIKYGSGPDDYTGISDIREVWWSATAVSNVDGKAGAYVAVDGGHRYQLGEIPSGPPRVFGQ